MWPAANSCARDTPGTRTRPCVRNDMRLRNNCCSALSYTCCQTCNPSPTRRRCWLRVSSLNDGEAGRYFGLPLKAKRRRLGRIPLRGQCLGHHEVDTLTSLSAVDEQARISAQSAVRESSGWLPRMMRSLVPRVTATFVRPA